MAWNEPGGDKDPWGNKGKGNGNDGPPDLDEVIKNLQQKFGGFFGGSSSGDNNSGDGLGAKGLIVIASILVGLWMMTGFYTVEQAERGVVLRFGSALEGTTDAGLNWHIPYPVDSVTLVNIDEFSSIRHKAKMLTQDENIVDIELTVQSKIEHPTDYLFQDHNPDKTMQDAMESIVRAVIGKSNLDFILTEGRSKISDDIREGIQALLIEYKTGLLVTSVNMQPAKPPEEVKEAFDDAIKAREDKAKLENQAEAYANEVIPVARGQAARQVADAEAYKERVIAEAEGEVSRFNAVLTQYEAAKEVTRNRIYLETIEEVLSNTSKVILDSDSANNLMYLPLDKMMNRAQTTGSSPQMTQPVTSATTRTLPSNGRRSVDRGRSIR